MLMIVLVTERLVMKILEVNYDEIQRAMEDIKRDRYDYYLDTKTGKVIALAEDLMGNALEHLYNELPDDDPDAEVLFDSELNTATELPDDIFDGLETALAVLPRTDRYLRIPERDRTEAFEAMKTFSGEQEKSELRSALLRSLNGARAFRKFKDTLKVLPVQRKAWNRYNAKQMGNVIREWLNGNGIRPARKRGSKRE